MSLKTSRFRVNLGGSNQVNIPDAKYVNAKFTTAVFNTGGLFNLTNSSVGPMPGPGTFQCDGQLWIGGQVNVWGVAKVIKNGVPLGGDDGGDVDAGIANAGAIQGWPAVTFPTLDECAAGDTYELIVYIAGGGQLDGNPAHTYWWGLFTPDPT
jgi:hypothetical protein